MSKKGETFITYLIQNGLYYHYNTIEDFLLSLKLNNSIVVTGISEIEKTSFLKRYLNYLVYSNKQKKISLNFTIGKTRTNRGFAIPRKDIYPILPKLPYEDGCNLIVGDYVVKAHLNILPRMFFKSSENMEFWNYLEFAKERGIEKIDYELILNEYDKLNYRIFNANHINKKYDEINNYIKESKENSLEDYFIIFNQVDDNNINSVLFDEDVIPSNMTVFYNADIKDCSSIADSLAIVQFDPVSPMDYLQNNLINIKFKNIEYLEDSQKEYLGNINDIKKSLQGIYVSENKSLYNILIDELNKLYHILAVDNIYISTNNVDNILKYMIVSWKYEGCPDIFSNWYRYFDFQIIQRIIPLLSGEVSIETFGALIDYCSDGFNYYRSYSRINGML